VQGNDVHTVDRAAVQRLLGEGATAIEALPQDYYEQGHLPGAINVALDRVESIPSVLPDKEAALIVYCADDSCSNSSIVGRQLTALGYEDVYVYEAGKRDWVDAGLALERAEVAR
jgi:rhodanese-related sulfurtransferase